ncbi:Hypothetical predicted protein [Paramuricea clavata]|uniref:Uncharacterized protein n=1 Tax=Paramuricea clavata TaxID=317549 RepID=A0A6S7LSX9_PARCT|nr:Hypothetical predicted protein [Paramuricea clavata]
MEYKDALEAVLFCNGVTFTKFDFYVSDVPNRCDLVLDTLFVEFGIHAYNVIIDFILDTCYKSSASVNSLMIKCVSAKILMRISTKAFTNAGLVCSLDLSTAFRDIFANTLTEAIGLIRSFKEEILECPKLCNPIFATLGLVLDSYEHIINSFQENEFSCNVVERLLDVIENAYSSIHYRYTYLSGNAIRLSCTDNAILKGVTDLLDLFGSSPVITINKSIFIKCATNIVEYKYSTRKSRTLILTSVIPILARVLLLAAKNGHKTTIDSTSDYFRTLVDGDKVVKLFNLVLDSASGIFVSIGKAQNNNHISADKNKINMLKKIYTKVTDTVEFMNMLFPDVVPDEGVVANTIATGIITISRLLQYTDRKQYSIFDIIGGRVFVFDTLLTEKYLNENIIILTLKILLQSCNHVKARVEIMLRNTGGLSFGSPGSVALCFRSFILNIMEKIKGQGAFVTVA